MWVHQFDLILLYFFYTNKTSICCFYTLDYEFNPEITSDLKGNICFIRALLSLYLFSFYLILSTMFIYLKSKKKR